MGLFKADLYRNFAIGFAIGAAAVGAMTADEWKAEIATPAYAASAEAANVAQ